jgi:integrase
MLFNRNTLLGKLFQGATALRDRALIATLTYSFARISAALKMKVEDLRPRGAGWTIRLHEKGGKQLWAPARPKVLTRMTAS